MANTRRIVTIKNGFAQEQVELSSVQASNKEITLSNTPIDNLQVSVLPVSGSPQKYGADFVVSGNVLSWNGFGLETILEQGDTLIIIYPI